MLCHHHALAISVTDPMNRSMRLTRSVDRPPSMYQKKRLALQLSGGKTMLMESIAPDISSTKSGSLPRMSTKRLQLWQQEELQLRQQEEGMQPQLQQLSRGATSSPSALLMWIRANTVLRIWDLGSAIRDNYIRSYLFDLVLRYHIPVLVFDDPLQKRPCCII